MEGVLIMNIEKVGTTLTRAIRILESDSIGGSIDESGSVDRKTALELIWKKTHKDYKGGRGKNRSIMVLRNGGSKIVLLTDLTTDEIIKRLPSGTSLSEVVS